VSKSELEAKLAQQMDLIGLPEPAHEHRFALALGRQWRFDFAWPDHMLAVEVEGGVWSQGRHTRGSGFIEDCTKYNNAALLGWTVLRVTADHIDSGEALAWIEDALAKLRESAT